MTNIPKDPIEPERKDFDTYDKYLEALEDWKSKMQEIYPNDIILTERESRLEQERQERAAMWTEVDYYENCGAYDMAKHTIDLLIGD